MKIFTLAKLLDHKYSLKSLAAFTITPEMKRDLIRAYSNYVSSSAKEPVLQMLSDAGEPVSSSITSDMASIIAGLDHPDIFGQHDNILDLMQNVVDTITPEAKLEVESFIKGQNPKNQQQKNHK